MPLPNRDIVSAIFESYITIRKPEWNLTTSTNTEDAIKTLPEKPAHKVNVCLDVLRQVKQASSFDDWLKLLDVLFEKEKADEATHDERYRITKLFVNFPMICNALHAARTYIISEIKSEPQFIKLKDESTREKIGLEKDILWDKAHGVLASEISRKQKLLDAVDKTLLTRDDTDEYYNEFFTKTIMQHDPLAKTLDEKSFDHFKLNVINKSRNLTQCERLLNEPTTNQPIENIAAKVEVKTEVKIESKAEPKAEAKPSAEPVSIKINSKTTEAEPQPSAYAENNLFAATANTRERRTAARRNNHYDNEEYQPTSRRKRY